MRGKFFGRNVRTVMLAASLVVVPFVGFPAHGGEPEVDVCRNIPDEEVARAVRGRILDSKPYDSKCVYIVAFDDDTLPRRTFVVYQNEADEYDGLRSALRGKVENIAGLGDEAVMTYDEESMRYWLLVVKRGQVTFQVSGDDPDTIRRLAEVVLPRLGAKE
jgi:hypothetical protein